MKMSEAGEGELDAEQEIVSTAQQHEESENTFQQHEESEKPRVFAKPLPYRPPRVAFQNQAAVEDDNVVASPVQSSTLSSRPMSESKRNLMAPETDSLVDRPISRSLRNLLASDPDRFEPQDRDALIALIAARDVEPAEAKWEDEDKQNGRMSPRADGAVSNIAAEAKWEDEDTQNGLLSPSTDGSGSNITKPRPSPVTSPVATSVLRNMVFSQLSAENRSSSPGYGRKARLVRQRQSEKEQKIAARMARLGFAPDPGEWQEDSPVEYNLGEPEKYTYASYKYPTKRENSKLSSNTSEIMSSGAARTTTSHIRLRPSSARPNQIHNDDLPYSSRIAVSKKNFHSRPLSAPLSRRGKYEVPDMASRRDLQPVVMPKSPTLSFESDNRGTLAEMKRKMLGFIQLHDEIDMDDLEGPDSARNEDSLSERSESENPKVQKKTKKELTKPKKLDTFQVLIEGAGEGSLAHFLAHGAEKAAPEAPEEKHSSKRPWRDKILKSAVTLQCAIRMHQARALCEELREENERTKAMRHRQRKEGFKRRLLGAAKLWGKVKSSMNDDQYSKSEEVCMVRAEEARLVARAMLASGRTHAAAAKLKEEEGSIDIAWHLLPSWVQNDLEELRSRKTEKALFEETEKMDLEWTNVGDNHFASYAQRYIRIWSVDKAFEVMEEEDVGKLAAGLGIWFQKLGAVVETQRLPALRQSLQWIRMCGYNVARAIRYYLSATKYLEEQVGKDGFTEPDVIQVSDIREVERCGLYWLRSPLGGALTDPDGRGVVVIHPPLLRSMQHSDAPAVSEGPAKGMCTDGRFLWRLTVFVRMMLDAVPKAQVNGITVLVDVTDERSAGLTYALLMRLQGFVLGTFPSLVRKVVIFGPSRNVMTGWATASRLLLPAFGGRLVYADNAQCTRFTLAAVSRELGIDLVAIPSGPSCPVEDEADEEEDAASAEDSMSVHPLLQDEFLSVRPSGSGELSVRPSASGEFASARLSNSGEFSPGRSASSEVAPQRPFNNWRRPQSSVVFSASFASFGAQSHAESNQVHSNSSAEFESGRAASSEVASQRPFGSWRRPQSSAVFSSSFASFGAQSHAVSNQVHSNSSDEFERLETVEPQRPFGSWRRPQNSAGAQSLAESNQVHSNSSDEFELGRAASTEVAPQRPFGSWRRPKSSVAFSSSLGAQSLAELNQVHSNSSDEFESGRAASTEVAPQQRPFNNWRKPTSLAEFSASFGAQLRAPSNQVSPTASDRGHGPSEAEDLQLEEEADDDMQEQVIYLEEHNFAQEAMLMGDGWYGTYDATTGKVVVEEGAKKIAGMPRKKAAAQLSLQETSSIPVILKALVSNSVQSRTQAARELALLCRGRRSEGRAAVTRSRGAKRVAAMLATHDAVEQDVACEALASVCSRSPENAAQVWEEDGGKKLLSLLTVGQVQVRGSASMALAAICEECDAACETMSQGEGIKGLLEAVRRGPDRIREGACLAIAAVCTKADGARGIMDRGGVDVVAKAMGKGGMSVRSAAARAIEGLLHREWEGRADVSRQVVEAGGFLLISDMVRAGGSPRAGAAELDCARSAAAAAAQGCRVDPRVAGELGRGGFVGSGLHLCLVSEPVNEVVRALAVRGAGVIETNKFLKAVRRVVRRDGGPEVLAEFLDPHGDGYVLETDWFAAQQSIMETLEGMLDSDLQVSSEDTCTDLSREEARLALILNRCLVRPQQVQISALGVLRRVCQHETHGPSSADTLATLGAVKSLMDLIKTDQFSSVHSRGLELLLEASKASEKFRRSADQKGVITVLKSLQHRAQEEELAGEVLGACERCLAFYMRHEAGLLYTMQAGHVDAQEKAAAAIWHMSANRPSVRGAILGKKGIVETVAWNGVTDGTCAETKLTFSNSETVVNRHHSKIARRSSLNVLRVLGQVPYETEMVEEKPVVRKIKTKSKLKRWMDYQSDPIHTLPYRPKTRASIEGWQGF